MKYLHITLHDNDFSIELESVGELVRNMFEWFGSPKETDLENLRVLVQNFLYNANKLHDLLDGSNIEVKPEYFLPTVEIVDETDVPDWDNSESIYISLDNSDCCELIVV